MGLEPYWTPSTPQYVKIWRVCPVTTFNAAFYVLIDGTGSQNNGTISGLPNLSITRPGEPKSRVLLERPVDVGWRV